MSLHDMPDGMKSEFLAAFRAEFGFGEMTATANDDAAAMLKAAAWAWHASREAVVVELPGKPCYRGYAAYDDAMTDAAKAIEARGLKVAP